MDLTEAVTWLNETTDDIDGIEYDHTAAAIRIVLARLAESEAGEVTTEYAVRWPPDGPFSEIEPHRTQEGAAWVVARYRDDGAELVQRVVRRGPWTAVGGEV